MTPSSSSGQHTGTDSPTQPALEAHAISVHYGPVHALNRVDLRVDYGRIRALIGTNGSGKSTLFKALMGLITPQEGSISQPSGSTIAYVPQSEAVDWHFPLNVRDVISSGRYTGGHWFRRLTSKDHAAITAALQRTGLTEYAHRQIGQLSGGQKKRTFLARGIAQQARIMLLDEPFAGVDTTNQTHITQLLRELASSGVAILVSTHDLARLSELADDVTLINRSVIAEGSVDYVLQPEHLMKAFGGGARVSGAF